MRFFTRVASFTWPVSALILSMTGLAFSPFAMAQSSQPEMTDASWEPGLEPSERVFAEAQRFMRQGFQQNQVSQFREAIPSFQRALDLYRELNVESALFQESRQGEVDTLNYLGEAYLGLGQNQQAIDVFRRSLEIAREMSYRQGEGRALNNLGNAHFQLRQYEVAIRFNQQSLTLARELGHRQGESSVLGSLGVVYRSQGQYQQAIDVFQGSLDIAREIGDRLREGIALSNLGNTHHDLGQYQQAIFFHEQSLGIAHEIGNRQLAALSLNNLSRAYGRQERYQNAIEVLRQSLTIAREIGDRQGEGIVLGNLGLAYGNLGQYQQAIDSYEHSLMLAREVGDRRGEGTVLGNLGVIYLNQGRYQNASAGYQQALAIAQEIGDREREGLWLSNIGGLLALQDEPELAIIFYKQSVNVRESIRDDIRTLPQEQQQSFTETVADDYRRLADLLLQADRVLEAQEVLDLLKLQELQDYDLHNVRGTVETRQGLDLWAAEQEILDFYSQSFQHSQTVDFEGFINSPEVVARVEQLQRNARGQNLNPQQLVRLQDNLQALGDAALLYPLILEDRLELVLVTTEGLVRRTVTVDRVALNEAVVNFRAAITHRFSDPIPQGRQLYQWLIAPIVDDLEQAGADTILYAADGSLRYIPLAALHNGDQYLTQRYVINHITAASLTDFSQSAQAPLNILAGAFPETDVTVDLGEDQVQFNGLPFAQAEVEYLEDVFPNTQALFSDAFNRASLEPALNNYTIIHLATHAEFRSGHPTDSYILLGDGDRITLLDLNDWHLPNVDLVVLSACKTAVSASTLGNGEEILGFGYQMQQTGADAAIASLWYVSDGGTQTLMNAFYAALQNGYRETEALRRAQVSLITGDTEILTGARDIQRERTIPGSERLSSQSDDLAHPYYWAPFILIGNGL